MNRRKQMTAKFYIGAVIFIVLMALSIEVFYRIVDSQGNPIHVTQNQGKKAFIL